MNTRRIIVGVVAFGLMSSAAWANPSLGGQVEGTAQDQQAMAASYSATDNNQDGLPESISIVGGLIDDGSGTFVGSIALAPGSEIERNVQVNGRIMAVVIYVGTSANDVLDARSYTHPVIFFGGNGRDDFRGGPHGDSAYLGDGNDDMEGNAGDDEAWGGDGDDDIGTDSPWGNDDPGSDEYTGGEGDDEIGGGTGDDTLSDSGETTPDTDRINAGTGNDTVNTDDADGNDTVNCGGGANGDGETDSVTADTGDSVNEATVNGVVDSNPDRPPEDPDDDTVTRVQ